jgi:hypothetical protein
MSIEETEKGTLKKKKFYLHVKCQLLFQNFLHDSIMLKDSEKLPLTNHHPVESQLLHAQRGLGRRTDGQTDITKIIFAI